MIKQIIHNQPNNVLRIEYMLGNTCNQKCNYCFPGSNEGDQPWPNIDIVKTNLSHLLDYYTQHNKTVFNIFFVGGEPTLWKDFLELCKYLKSNYNCILEISTNGTRSTAWWKQAAQHLDHINISVHHEYANIHKILKLADYLYEQGVFVNVDVLIDPLLYDRCVELVKQLTASKHKWPVIAKVVHYNGIVKYNNNQLRYFDQPIKQYPSVEWFTNTFRKPRTNITIINEDNTKIVTDSDSWITRNNLNFFKGWTCNLGVDHIKIFHNGTITGNCQQILYNKTKNYNLYHNDFVKNFDPTISPVVCSRTVCGCTGEISINKWKTNV